ncbi:MAG: IS1380 family transposase, partial [Hyphomicrobiales bacterium]|nr:IS1380 family transposase [Hyphomicrobiales bacterium]
MLSALAYTLLETVRRIALKDTGMAHVQCGMIRLRLLKIVALIVRNTR